MTGKVYCGPLAIAYITRLPLAVVEDALTMMTGRKVRRMYDWQTLNVLGFLGYEARLLAPQWRCTAYGYWKAIREPVPYIASMSTHYAVIDGEEWYDNNCPHGPVPVPFADFRLGRLQNIIKVRKRR